MAANPPPAWMIRLNIAVLRRGLRLGSQHLLTAPGWKTGQPRSTPVSVATVGGTRYLVAAFADAAWVRNVRTARAATLMRGGRSERITLNELPVTERGPILAAFLQQVRGGVRFFGGQTPDQVVAGAEHYPVFRISDGGADGAPAGTSSGSSQS